VIDPVTFVRIGVEYQVCRWSAAPDLLAETTRLGPHEAARFVVGLHDREVAWGRIVDAVGCDLARTAHSRAGLRTAVALLFSSGRWTVSHRSAPRSALPALRAREEAPTPGASPPETHWLGIELRGETGAPVAHARYEVELPGGERRSGALDRDGCATLTGLRRAGECIVRFPAHPRVASDTAEAVTRGARDGWWVTAGTTDTVDHWSIRYGVPADDIWNHSANRALVSERSHRNALAPGDQVFVPDAAIEGYGAQADQAHRFECTRPTLLVKVRLQHGLQALGGVAVTVTGEGLAGAPPTCADGDGVVEVRVRPTCERITVVVPSRRLRYELRVGRLEPTATPRGKAARLQALDLLPAMFGREGEHVERFAEAVANGLARSPRAAEQKLRELFGV
jgi:hypothetical protein